MERRIRSATFLTFILAVTWGAGMFGTACTSAPTEEDFRRYDALYREQARPELEALETERAAGTISADEYTHRRRTIEDGIASAVSQAIFTHHQLATLPPSDKDVFARPHGVQGSRTAGGGGSGGSGGGSSGSSGGGSGGGG